MSFTKEQAKATSILSIASSLGIELKKISSNIYEWTEHDSFKIYENTNSFSWFSKSIHGDTIALVQTIKEISFRDAIKYIESGDLPEVTIDNSPKKPFQYYLAPYEYDHINQGRTFLNDTRGLSDDTINTFRSKGLLAQARLKGADGIFEPVIVFKFLNKDQKIIGCSLQGIYENNLRHEHGRLKKVIGDGSTGLNIDIGKPERLVFLEAPIDLMSYYELNKDSLENVRLVAMDGLKDTTISRHLYELLAEKEGLTDINLDDAKKLLSILSNTNFFDQDKNSELITLAVDNDKAGLGFIEKLESKNIKFNIDLPPLHSSQIKNDWNDELKYQGDNSRLAQAQRKLERLEKEVSKSIDADIISDQAQQLIDSGEVTQWAKKPTFYFVKGLKKVALELDANGDFQISKQYNVKTEADQKFVTDLLNKDIAEQRNSIQKKALDLSQELKSPDGGTFNRNPSSLDSQAVKVAPQPVERTQPDFLTDDLLYFTTNNSKIKVRKDGYFPIKDNELRKLNLIAPSLQKTAQFYIEKLSGATINYVYKDNNEYSNMAVKFEDENFMHLTGILPYDTDSTRTASQTLSDFAKGRGSYDNLLVSAAFKDKLTVLPLIPEIIDSKSFILDDLSEVEKFERLQLDKAIKTEDEELFMAFRDVDGIGFPASIMRIKGNLKTSLKDDVIDKTILGVFREQNDVIETLSINSDLVHDNGAELKTFLTNTLNQNHNSKQQGEIMKEESKHLWDKAIKVALDETPEEKSVSDMILEKDTKALSKHMKDGIKDYLNSDQYALFLKTMGKLHNYSPKNIQLLLSQNKNISMVAGFNTWKNDFQRTVNKGEKSLKIWMPFTVKQKDENGKIKLDDEGKPITFTGFKLGSVFDVSQTSGKNIPKAINELSETNDDYQDLYRSLRATLHESKIDIEWKNLSEANGYYSPNENKIVVKSGLSSPHTIKTILHEMAHSRLHKEGSFDKFSEAYKLQELQAESIAYVVSNHFGIDTGSYSFGYLASWSDDKKDLSDFESQLSIIQYEAKKIIETVDAKLELIKEKGTIENTFEKKFSSFKQEKSDKEVGNDLSQNLGKANAL